MAQFGSLKNAGTARKYICGVTQKAFHLKSWLLPVDFAVLIPEKEIG